MKKLFLLTLILTSSCSSNVNLVDELNFSEDVNIDEFILKLETYSKNNPYPNIDN
jgi:hypothetical protein